VVGNEDVATAVVIEIGKHELARVLRLRNVSAEERVRVVDEFAVESAGRLPAATAASSTSVTSWGISL
jgi:hypothetical protein